MMQALIFFSSVLYQSFWPKLSNLESESRKYHTDIIVTRIRKFGFEGKGSADVLRAWSGSVELITELATELLMACPGDDLGVALEMLSSTSKRLHYFSFFSHSTPSHVVKASVATNTSPSPSPIRCLRNC